MDRVIYKYEVSWTNQFKFGKDFKVLLFARKDGLLNIWVEHNLEIQEDSPVTTVSIVPTGCRPTVSSTHLASCIDGEFVWHLYQEF